MRPKQECIHSGRSEARLEFSGGPGYTGPMNKVLENLKARGFYADARNVLLKAMLE
jgi:hypothetical protein